jgi:hypothetical protein
VSHCKARNLKRVEASSRVVTQRTNERMCEGGREAAAGRRAGARAKGKFLRREILAFFQNSLSLTNTKQLLLLHLAVVLLGVGTSL